MGFIKLTRCDGQPVYVNMTHIRLITVLQGETALDVVGWEGRMCLTVKESPDAIMALMELKERGKNA